MTFPSKQAPIIDSDTLRRSVNFVDLIDPVAMAFRDSSAGLAENRFLRLVPGSSPDDGDVFVKTGVLRGHRVFVIKVSPWLAVNAQRGHPQGGFIAVCDAQTGYTLAILDDRHYLSDIRTAAAGAVAARYLCPHTARQAAVLGCGVQAYWQVRALHHERPIQRLMIWARDAAKASALASRLSVDMPLADISVSVDLERTVREADAVITTTSSRKAFVDGDWLHPGQHITAVGADDPMKCELTVSALAKARVFVDAVHSTEEVGDVHAAIASGHYSSSNLAGEIGDVIAGRKPGRQSDSDITIAKFVGIGAQDLVAAEITLAKLGLTN